MSISFFWELTCDRLVSHPGGVKDSHPFSLWKPEISTGSNETLASEKDLALELIPRCLELTK